ncbi:MAG: carbonic anhydrase, partial [Chthoniobacterales bacterium]
MNPKSIRLLTFALLIAGAFPSIGSEPAGVTPDDALKRLVDGNARFVAGNSTAPRGGDLVSRRGTLTRDQNPFALIVSCSDSRVPPEL